MEQAKEIIGKAIYPLESNIVSRKIAAFDIETELQDDAHVFMCGSIWSDKLKRCYFNKDEMAHELLSNKFSSYWIFATSLDFDFFALFGDLWYKHDMQLCFRGSNLISVMMKGWKKTEGHHNPRRFLDTMNYYPASLNKLGGCINMEKLPRPKAWLRKPANEVEMQELIAYNMHDSEMTYEWVKWFQEKLNFINCNMKNTIASTSLWNYRRHYQKQPIWQPQKSVMEDQLLGYYGGRTECFYRGTYEGNIYLYDANGMHAWAMTLEFPESSSLFFSDSPSLDDIFDYHGVCYCEIEAPKDLFYPLLPYRLDKKLLFPLGKFRGWHACVELRKAIELGYNIAPVKGYFYYHNHFPFAAIQKEYYKLRKSSKEMQLVYKLLSNALYGKWAQRWDDEIIYQHISKLSHIPSEFLDIRNDFVLTKKSREPSNFINPIYSIYTTAYARLRLYSHLVKYNGFYCDTDSIITTDKMPESNELGEFKLERKMKKIMIIRPKVYFLEDELGHGFIKVKGMRVKTQEEFQFMVAHGCFPVERIMKFKESVRRRKTVLKNIRIPKKININDDKRIWQHAFVWENWEKSKPRVIL